MVKTKLSPLVALSMVWVVLILTGCSLFRAPELSVSNVVGTWNSKSGAAVITFRGDMTFEVKGVSSNYLDNLREDVDTPASGTWKLDGPASNTSNPDILLEGFSGSGSYSFMNTRFSGDHLSQIYLTNGDPDNGDFLEFVKEDAEP